MQRAGDKTFNSAMETHFNEEQQKSSFQKIRTVGFKHRLQCSSEASFHWLHDRDNMPEEISIRKREQDGKNDKKLEAVRHRRYSLACAGLQQ